jgi:predicted nuclease with TOPRIM domain|tara:strand:- start:3931 stop:4143 length:213 start_codon:yes stop_codon:yes gene_type:complete
MEVLMTEKVEVTLARLEERLTQLQDEVRHVHEEVSELKAQANRWKGAFWVMLAMGGIVGSIAHLVVGWIR